jgi:transposase
MNGPDGRAVGSNSGACAGCRARANNGKGGTTLARPSRCAQRDPLDIAHWSSVGRPSESVSAVYDLSSSFPKMGQNARARSNSRSPCKRLTGKRQARPERSVHRRQPCRRKKRGALVGKTRRGKATKIMAISDRNGLPIAVGIASGECHETKLVLKTLQSRFVADIPKRLIGDRAYDSDKLDAEMREFGIEMISPHRTGRKVPTQDGRPLRRYRRRWVVERLFSWVLQFRRVITRFEYHAANFLGFLKAACLVILLRRL